MAINWCLFSPDFVLSGNGLGGIFGRSPRSLSRLGNFSGDRRSAGQRRFNLSPTSEITQQQFRGAPQLYLNQVETTTDYRQISPKMITANQVTAIYLTPNDPNFFTTQYHPVALYHYELSLQKVD